VDLRMDEGSPPAHHYDVEAGPTREVRWTGEVATPKSTYSKMADSAADALGLQLVAAMQMGE
jgi:hypothetical protein